MRKEKQKHQKAAMDELERTDPEAYLEAIQRAEKERLEERMSLKHKGGSKHMNKQTIYGKYDLNVSSTHDRLNTQLTKIL